METIRVGYVRSGVGQVTLTNTNTYTHISDIWLSNVEHVFSLFIFAFFIFFFFYLKKTGVKFSLRFFIAGKGFYHMGMTGASQS